MERSGDAIRVEKMTEVGRYALGVQWGDRHDSILPYRNLRRACSCETCAGESSEEARTSEAERLVRAELLGDRSVFLRWGDGHESVFLVEELRDLCRCARCVGEPDVPISGR